MDMIVHNTQNAPHNAYMGASRQRSEWVQDEVNRLRSMGDLLAAVSEADLATAFDTLNAEHETWTSPSVLDVGAGSARDVRETVERFGGEYYAYDVNQELINANSAPDDHKLYDPEGHIPAADHSFDIVFARAVAGWNHTPDKIAAMLSEMLRVVRPGGMLVISDFVWNDAGPVQGENPLDVDLALMEAKAGMLMALASPRSGFDPDYGNKLGPVLDRMLQDDMRYAGRTETRHKFPPADYRQVLLETASNIKIKLDESGGGLASVPAAMLQESIPEIRDAERCIITLPTLVTQVVRVNPSVTA